jgi:hypothetical protein
MAVAPGFPRRCARTCPAVARIDNRDLAAAERRRRAAGRHAVAAQTLVPGDERALPIEGRGRHTPRFERCPQCREACFHLHLIAAGNHVAHGRARCVERGVLHARRRNARHDRGDRQTEGRAAQRGDDDDRTQRTHDRVRGPHAGSRRKA